MDRQTDKLNVPEETGIVPEKRKEIRELDLAKTEYAIITDRLVVL